MAAIVRVLLLLLLAGAASALEVHLVAARGRPIGPPEERQAPERAAAGAEGVADDSFISSSRAEYLMHGTISSPPHDLPVLRESVEQSQVRKGGSMAMLLQAAGAAMAVSGVVACAFLFLEFQKRLRNGFESKHETAANEVDMSTATSPETVAGHSPHRLRAQMARDLQDSASQGGGD